MTDRLHSRRSMHCYLIPVPLMVTGFGFEASLLLSIAIIWLAHIDRAFGYGLKYSAGLGFTHLGRIGMQRLAAPEPN